VEQGQEREKGSEEREEQEKEVDREAESEQQSRTVLRLGVQQSLPGLLVEIEAVVEATAGSLVEIGVMV
jgi:hypothetical protein